MPSCTRSILSLQCAAVVLFSALPAYYCPLSGWQRVTCCCEDEAERSPARDNGSPACCNDDELSTGPRGASNAPLTNDTPCPQCCEPVRQALAAGEKEVVASAAARLPMESVSLDVWTYACEARWHAAPPRAASRPPAPSGRGLYILKSSFLL